MSLEWSGVRAGHLVQKATTTAGGKNRQPPACATSPRRCGEGRNGTRSLGVSIRQALGWTRSAAEHIGVKWSPCSPPGADARRRRIGRRAGTSSNRCTFNNPTTLATRQRPHPLGSRFAASWSPAASGRHRRLDSLREDFPYWLKRAFGAMGALRAARARRPRAPNFTGARQQKSADAPKDTDAQELQRHHTLVTVLFRVTTEPPTRIPTICTTAPRHQKGAPR
jgi:hypothetical protein